MITQRGIGNGMSVLIFASVVAGLPALGCEHLASSRGVIWFIISMILLLLLCFGHRVHRERPASDPHQLPEAGGWPPSIRWQQDLHPAQGQPGRCDPRDLRHLRCSSLPSLVANVLPTNATQDSWGDVVRRFIQNRLFQPTDPAYILIFGLLIIGSPTSTIRSPSIRPAGPTNCASQAVSSPAFVPDLRPSATCPRC